MRDETVFVFAFNQMNVPEPERAIAPLDSGFSKAYQVKWEAWRKMFEPVMVEDPRNLYIEVMDVAEDWPIVVMMHSAKLNRTCGRGEITEFEKKVWRV